MTMFTMIRRTALLSLAALLIVSLYSPTLSAASPAASSLKVPAFSATALDGRTVSSANLAGKTYIVNFFASWCPPCRAEIPDMVELQKAYTSKGFTFVGIAVSDSEPSIRDFVRRSGISYPVVVDNGSVASAFSPLVSGGLRSIPTSFVVNASGRVTHVFAGARSREAFKVMIDEALGKPKTAK
ncbi:MAG TPA: redoxin [Chlorobium sp.]|nr:redoxin [Chlorobium sp.]